MTFENKRCLITGGSSGIGLALAKQLAAAGADVWLLASGAERLESARKAVEPYCRRSDQIVKILQADVVDSDQVQQCLQPWLGEQGAPDFLVNSAGVARPGYAEELPIEVFHRMMDVNYFGTVHVTQTLLPAMLARGSGHIVNLSSIAGFIGVFGYTAYGASKYAVRGYSEALRAELKPRGLRVSIVYPPDTDTPQLAYENQFKPAETTALAGNARPMTAEQVADAILRGVAKGRYLILPGLEGKLLYRLSGVMGPWVYPLLDWLVSRARSESRPAEESGR